MSLVRLRAIWLTIHPHSRNTVEATVMPIF